MLYLKATPLLITFLLLPQVHGGLLRELCRKFLEFFKSSKSIQPIQPGPFYENCNLCLFGPCTPMIWPSNNNNFDGSEDAEKIMTALAGTETLTSDQQATVANILTQRSAPQRTAIAEAFINKCDKEIIVRLREKMSFFWRYYMLIRDLSSPLPRFYRQQLRVAINYQKREKAVYREQGQAIIVEIFTTLPKCLLDKTIESYNSIPDRDLIPDLDKALVTGGKSSEYREVIKKLAEQTRDTDQHGSWIKALTDAYKLKSAVISRRETEMKERFSEFFTKRSLPQIFETLVVYDNLRNGEKEYRSLHDDIDKYTRDEKEIYKIMVRLFTNKPLYYAKTIEGILKSGQTEEVFEERLISMIVGRFDIDLKDIFDAYNQQSETGLRADFVAWDISKWSGTFHGIMLNILDRAARMP